MTPTATMERRDFLKFTVAASGGLLIGFALPELSKSAEASETAKEFWPNAFVRIGTDERITVIVNHSEMGQGVYTALPQILAEELDADWKNVHFEPAPVDKRYNHPVFGMQMTGGSTSIWSSFDQYRKAGAAARAMLIAAAAKEWGSDASGCRAENGRVIHSASGKSLAFGHLAESAAAMAPPTGVRLKDPKDFKLIGKPVKRLDTREKLDGSGVFGMDVKLPGLWTAVVARPPLFGAKVKSFDGSAALKVKGVRKVAQVPSGVAVIADGFWPAKRGRDALKIEWDEGPLAGFSSEAQRAQFLELAAKPGLVARNDGDVAAALASGRKLDAVYEVPYLSHAMMEPLNCSVDLRADRCDVWTGTQFQTIDRAAAAEVAGLPLEKVQVHTTLLGGGFGRRATPASDFVREAVYVAKEAQAPVKVIWTREDDMRGGYYRPAYLHALAGAVDANGQPVAWRQRIVGQSITGGTPFEPFTVKGGIDSTSVEGAADMAYAIPNVAVELHSPKFPIPVLWLRSVGHSHTAFVKESFLDELAHMGRQDPYELRRKLLAKSPRLLALVETVAKMSGWGSPLPKGHGRGIAAHESFGSFSAQAAEVSVEGGKVHVHKFYCAVDCGAYVNPGIIEAQAHSGVIFGMSAALYNELTFQDGRVRQRNFHDYPMVRINECPRIEVHVAKNNEKSGGIGEPGVPCVAPAIGNAIFAATGKRVRKLPIRMSEAV